MDPYTDAVTEPVLPSVTVIVLNYNGLDHLKVCFDSLARVEYPAGRLQLMLVDNASSDGSVKFVERSYPQVRIVRNQTNLGFSPANNRGAREADSQYVVFLNNDMQVEPGFVRGLVNALQTVPGAVSAGAKILNWDGSRFDFAGSAAHFAGYAYQVAFGKPYRPELFNEVHPILFACGGAMLVDRQVFLEAGGFDEDFFIYYEDLDLGWRMWVLGHQVVFAPEAVVRHRHHGTMDGFSDYRKQVLYKRNALSAALKNYSDENLGRVLPAILLGTVAGLVSGAARRGDLDLSEYFIKSRSKAARPVSLDRQDASTLVAMHEIVERLPQLMARRGAIQARRKRPDEEVARLFDWPFRLWPDVDAQTQYRVAEAFGVQRLFHGLPRRLLVISSDILPYPGMPTVGSGLRAWGLGQGLKSRGHEVLYSMPRAALEGRETLASPEVRELAWTHGTLAGIVHTCEPDAVVVCNWPVLDALATARVSVPVILDQHGPHFLEREYQGFGESDDNARRKLSALRKADFFTCAGERQLRYFQSWLERAGWTETERQERSAAIPVSLAPELPAHSPDGELTFVYGGVFLPWQDPTPGLDALLEALAQHRRGRLFFYGGRHPVYPVDPGLFDGLLDRLKHSPYVVAPGMVPHDELVARYRQAHVALDVMRRNPERELAFTTRTVEYLWCGLPVITHNYAELSDYVREYEAGWVVDPEDPEAIRAAIEEIFAHPEEAARRGENAQRLVREKLTWDRTIAPLDEFVRSPRLRPHDYAREQLTPIVQDVPYLASVAWAVYRRRGLGALWREGWTFLRQQRLLFK